MWYFRSSVSTTRLIRYANNSLKTEVTTEYHISPKHNFQISHNEIVASFEAVEWSCECSSDQVTTESRLTHDRITTESCELDASNSQHYATRTLQRPGFVRFPLRKATPTCHSKVDNQFLHRYCRRRVSPNLRVTKQNRRCTLTTFCSHLTAF